jgi:tungstate transport system substrate-binding protein
MTSPLDRRELLAAAALAGLASCSRDASGPAGAPLPDEPPDEPGVVRVGILPALIERFEHTGALRVRLTAGTDVYDQARAGKVDVVVSHYGHRDAEAFVLDGCGEWPRMIFSNQMALVGPPSDPARVRGLGDAGVAFQRIAASGSKFLVNGIDGVRYLTEILWNAAGRPARGPWLIETGSSKDAAIREASASGAYTLWGLTPFLALRAGEPLALEPLVLGDPLLQRMLVSVIVKPGGGRRVNATGAGAFQSFLLAPSTQAQIRTIHYPGHEATAWVPAGRHNRTAILPKT